MDDNENLNTLIKLGMVERCKTCGDFFIGASVRASTESGNYGIYFENIENYPLDCGRCPKCAMECYKNLDEFIDENGYHPCTGEILDREEVIYAIPDYLDPECYYYTDEYQNKTMSTGNPNINAGLLIDLTEILLEKIS
ncbi:MAG: hypothetical protein GF311_26320 [Candidatus Lokiarchaeota archaeon]|nr:hypothetical protein [Candidatus Lokiarchaeota archaeon]